MNTNPALDPTLIAAHLPSTHTRHDTALNRARNHLDTHGGYIAWSGGKDSTTVVHLATRTHPHTPVVWFNSGLEFPDTPHYLHALAEQWNLNFHVINATPDALTILRDSAAWTHSNPETPGIHHNMHAALITVPATEARHRFGNAETWGLRASESNARRILLSPQQGTFTRADGTVTHSPIWDWRDIDVTSYLAHHHIPLHPTYLRLRQAGAKAIDMRMGMALDGNSLNFGRVTWLKRCYPETFDQLANTLPRLREWA